MILSILDTDLYKFSTSNAYFQLYPLAEGTFTFNDRGKEIYDEDITLEEYIEENDLGNSIPKDAKASSGDKDEDEDLSADE